MPDVHDPRTGRHVVEIVLVPDEGIDGRPLIREPGREPRFVRMDDLPDLDLRPSVGTLLRDLRDLRDLHGDVAREGPGVPGPSELADGFGPPWTAWARVADSGSGP